MHVVLVSIGTDGDIFPYVGLGTVLLARGHTITLVASEHYEPLARRHGFDFHALVTTAENQELFNHPDFWHPLKTAPLSARWGVRFIRRQYELLKSITTPDTVLIASPGVFAASLVHDKLGVPWANLIPQPWLLPSPESRPVIPSLEFLSHAPPTVWKLFQYGMNLYGGHLFGRELNQLRAELGLKPWRRVFSDWLSPQLVLGLFPDWFAPIASDWPRQVRLVGFPLFDGTSNQSAPENQRSVQAETPPAPPSPLNGERAGVRGESNLSVIQNADLPPELQAFCQSGPPPIAFTFGTGMVHSAHLFRAALDACQILGTRAIFLTKFRDQLPVSLPRTVLPCAFAPFAKLFPHCAAIVHHGGIGTTAQCLAAGVPQLIHPICFDQIDNGVRVQRLGAGDYIRATPATGKQIALALQPLLTAEVQSRCHSLTHHFAHTNALETAATLTEALVSSSNNRP